MLKNAYVQFKNSAFAKYVLFYSIGVLLVSYNFRLHQTLSDWLFDDIFVSETGLTYYIDFRPGYPPLGKIYLLFANVRSIIPSISQSDIILFYNLIAACVAAYFLYLILRDTSAWHRRLSLVFLALPTTLIAIIGYAHSDLFALLFFLGTIYFSTVKNNYFMSGIMCALGTLTKIYPCILLPILLIILRKLEHRALLLASFTVTFLIVSFPFLMADPYMYGSTFIHHLSRGPCETIFSTMDGFIGHSGFPHPTYDATLYSWQFIATYEPSQLDHFVYLWKYPLLKVASTILSILFVLGFSFCAPKKSTQKRVILLSISAISFFAFSTFYNSTLELVLAPLIVLTTIDFQPLYTTLLLIGFEGVNIIHLTIWDQRLVHLWNTAVLGTYFPLLVITVTRVLLYGVLFLSIALYSIRARDDDG